MKELGKRARALLDATQFADEPSQKDYDRVHSAVTARIAVGLAVGAAVTAVARTASAAAPTASVATASAAPAAAAAVAAPSVVGATVGTGVAATMPAAKVLAWVLVASMTAGVGTSAVVVSRGHSPEKAPTVTPSSARAPAAPPRAAAAALPARPSTPALPTAISTAESTAQAPSLRPVTPPPQVAAPAAVPPLNSPPAPRRGYHARVVRALARSGGRPHPRRARCAEPRRLVARPRPPRRPRAPLSGRRHERGPGRAAGLRDVRGRPDRGCSRAGGALPRVARGVAVHGVRSGLVHEPEIIRHRSSPS